MNTWAFNWRNDWARRDLTLAEWGALAQAGPKALAVNSNVAFHLDGHRRVSAVADRLGSKVFAYVHVLHTWHPGGTLGMLKDWPFSYARMEQFGDTYAFDDEGRPAVIWPIAGAPNHESNVMHMDPSLSTPEDYARLIVEFVERYPVDGLYLDYLSHTPHWFPDHNSSAPVFDLDIYRRYQLALVSYLGLYLPDTEIITNGRWPVDEPRQFRNTTYTFFEGGGGHWYDADTILQRIGALDPSRVVYDERRSPKIDAATKETIAKTVQALGGARAVWVEL